MSSNITSIGEILFDIYHNHKNLGGAPFNFIYHIKKITGQGNFISAVGRDALGKEIINFIEKNNMSANYIQIDDQYPTGTAYINLSKNKIPEFKISPNCAYDFIELNELNENVIKNNTDILYFGTLAQRSSVTRKTIRTLLQLKARNFLDLNLRQNYYNKNTLYNSLRYANVVKMNVDELKTIIKYFFGADSGIENSYERLVNKFHLDVLCITMGKNGAVITNGESFSYYSKKLVGIVDTVGAGDAYAAILCLGFARGWDFDKINLLATEFAGKICAVKGALPNDDKFYAEYVKEFQNGKN